MQGMRQKAVAQQGSPSTLQWRLREPIPPLPRFPPTPWVELSATIPPCIIGAWAPPADSLRMNASHRMPFSPAFTMTQLTVYSVGDGAGAVLSDRCRVPHLYGLVTGSGMLTGRERMHPQRTDS